MAKTIFYNQKGENIGDIELSDAVFAFPIKESAVYQAFVALSANERQPWADTKNKGEVRGGGRKPWKQKGTGRARHGSIRSPIWKGGGVTFGPLSIRSYKQKLNKKTNLTAVKSCLSARLTEKNLLVVENWPVDGKTKTLFDLRANLPGNGKTTVFLTSEKNDQILKAAQNLSKVSVIRAMDVNVKDLLTHQYLILDKESVAVLEKRLGKSKK